MLLFWEVWTWNGFCCEPWMNLEWVLHRSEVDVRIWMIVFVAFYSVQLSRLHGNPLHFIAGNFGRRFIWQFNGF